jgi:hypothetical protein
LPVTAVRRFARKKIGQQQQQPQQREALSTLFFRPSDPESLVKRDPVRRKRKVPWWTDGRTDV